MFRLPWKDVGVSVNEPFEIDVPGTFAGGFGSSSKDKYPFTLDLTASDITKQRPDVSYCKFTCFFCLTTQLTGHIWISFFTCLLSMF